MKGNTRSRTVSNIRSGASSLKRDQRSASWRAVNTGFSIGWPVRVALVLLAGVQLVQTLDEQQVGELLDDGERIRDAAGPHGVPDSVDLGLQLTGDHDSISLVSIESSNRPDLELKPLRGYPARWWSPGATAPSDTMVSGRLVAPASMVGHGALIIRRQSGPESGGTLGRDETLACARTCR